MPPCDPAPRPELPTAPAPPSDEHRGPILSRVGGYGQLLVGSPANLCYSTHEVVHFEVTTGGTF